MVTIKVGKGKIFVIDVYNNFSTKNHEAELFEDHDNADAFVLHGIVFLLGSSQFTQPIHNRSFLLDDQSTHMVVKSISVNVEWYVMVVVCHEDIPQPG